MFVVYTRQIEWLDNQYQNQLVDQIDEHLKVHFSTDYHQMSDDQRRVFINDSIRTGQTFDLSTDRNLTVFVDFTLTFGTNFPFSQDWALSVLTDEELAEDEKIDRLLALLDED